MTPAIPAPPAPVSIAASGGTWASGNSQTDASSAQAFDEYAVYTQWVNIYYSRNPVRTENLNAQWPIRNLSQLSGLEVLDVKQTELHYTITAHTSCTFVSGTYAASSFYQPQKLSLNANEYDKNGDTYGAVSGNSALSGLVFGSNGSVTTTQPYLKRHPKTGADVEYDQTDTGTTHALIVSSTTGGAVDHWLNGAAVGLPYMYYLDDDYDLGSGWANPKAWHKVGGTDFWLFKSFCGHVPL